MKRNKRKNTSIDSETGRRVDQRVMNDRMKQSESEKHIKLINVIETIESSAVSPDFRVIEPNQSIPAQFSQ